jgi:hypothetical protein
LAFAADLAFRGGRAMARFLPFATDPAAPGFFFSEIALFFLALRTGDFGLVVERVLLIFVIRLLIMSWPRLGLPWIAGLLLHCTRHCLLFTNQIKSVTCS